MYPQAISHGNILTFTPPGFNQELNVKFPDSRLAVCEKCKKNYKTRDMCRVRNHHTGAPWTTAYVCITLDDTCTDENGKYIDKPLTVRMVQWQPFCVKKPFDSQHPVCSSCKKTNRTRSFCRERHKHRHLPWCTVYVMLSALDSTDPSTVVADPSKPLDAKEEKETNENSNKDGKENGSAEKEKEEEDAPEEKSEEAEEAPSEKEGNARKGEAAGTIDSEFEETDDIRDIPESRTFLAKVSYKGISIHWLDLAEYEPSDTGVAMGFVAPDAMRQASSGIDPNQAQYYAQAMGYTTQHHQEAIKSQQQYYYQMRGQPFPAQQWPTQYTHQQEPGAAPPSNAAPVTAGEAAAQQQKQNQSAADGDQNGAASPGQWQMMYPPQMYQMQPGQFAGDPSQKQADHREVSQDNGDLGGEMGPSSVGDEGDEGPDAKRIRMV